MSASVTNWLCGVRQLVCRLWALLCIRQMAASAAWQFQERHFFFLVNVFVQIECEYTIVLNTFRIQVKPKLTIILVVLSLEMMTVIHLCFSRYVFLGI